jgi:glycerol uptake facilitator-like aquaporin
MRALVAETIGTAFLLASIVGSGIMGERLAGGNIAIVLLASSIAIGAALVALIVAFAPISGAHFNPIVSFVAASFGAVTWTDASRRTVAQVIGGVLGVAAANVMFGEPVVAWSVNLRSGIPQVFSEWVATFGLVMVIWGAARGNAAAVPYAVGAYITAAIWFTASTSFANPAVTIARALTNTIAGIRPDDVPAFVGAQIVGAASAAVLLRWLLPPEKGS